MLSSHSPNASAPVGLFDSGVGGISIANAVSTLLPNEDLVYVADSANAPYGEKSSEFLLARCQQIVDFLLSQKVKLVVVACNTATLACIGRLRALYPIDFVGVEPGIKPALGLTQTGVIGVMATQNTLNSDQYAQLQKRYIKNNSIINQPCNGLVEQIESLQFDDEQTATMLRTYLQPMLDAKADHIVLGCTHYGFISKQVASIAGAKVKLVNTSEAIAIQVKNRLSTLGLINPKTSNGAAKLYCSATDEKTQQACRTLWHHNDIKITPFDID